MIDGKTVLAIIPARGGSKGIKDKNIISVHGKPLITYSIDTALKSKYIDYVLVSTDSEKIAAISRENGAYVPFLRPNYLASDTSTTLEAVIHALRSLGEMGEQFDYLVLLQPTQPLRSEDDVDNAIELCVQNKRGTLSVSPVKDHPILVRFMDANGEMCKLLPVGSTVRRQDMPSYYRVNGCVYVNPISEVTETLSFNDNPIPYIMPQERSVDIDGYEDVALVEYYLSRR